LENYNDDYELYLESLDLNIKAIISQELYLESLDLNAKASISQEDISLELRELIVAEWLKIHPHIRNLYLQLP